MLFCDVLITNYIGVPIAPLWYVLICFVLPVRCRVHKLMLFEGSVFTLPTPPSQYDVIGPFVTGQREEGFDSLEAYGTYTMTTHPYLEQQTRI